MPLPSPGTPGSASGDESPHTVAPKASDRRPKNPYAAPDCDDQAQEAAPIAHAEAAGYKSQSRVVLLISALLSVQFVLALSKGIACLLLNTGTLGSQYGTELVDATQHASTGLQYLFWATWLPFGTFLVRANKNARVFGMTSVAFSPASMVWWYFVPLLSLVRPFQAVKAVWAASAPTEEDSVAENDSNIVPLWWTAWLVDMFVSRLINFALSDPEPYTYNIALAVECATSAVLYFFALRMVRALHARQQQRATEEIAQPEDPVAAFFKDYGTSEP
jgi:hypothetical protein